MKASGKTPKYSPSPIRDVQDNIGVIAELLHSTDPAERESALRVMCLKREGNRCIITGSYDSILLRKLPKQQQQHLEDSGTSMVRTDTAHIIPFSLANYTPGTVGIQLLCDDFIGLR